VAFRVVLTSSGLIEYRDATFEYESSIRTAKYFHTWNPYKSSDNFPYLNQLPIYFWWSLTENTESNIRLTYFIIFVLIGTIIFSTVFVWLKERYENIVFCYIASTATLFVYIVNPWVTFHITHPHFLWSYAFTPLIFYLTRKAVNQTSRKGWIKYSLILSLVLFLTTTSYVGIMVNFLLFAYVLVFENLFKIKESFKRFSYSAVKSAILFVSVSVLTLLLFAYYFLPYVGHYGTLLSPEAITSYKTFVVTIEDIIKRDASKSILRAIIGLIIYREFQYSIGGNLTFLWTVSTIVIPILAFLALILKPRNKEVLTLSSLALIMIFLAKGSNEPFSSVYIWLYLLLESQLGGLSPLKFLQSGMPLLYLSYAWLCGVAMTEILNRTHSSSLFKSESTDKKSKSLPISFFKVLIRKHIIGVLAVSLLFCSIAFTNFPFFTGDLRGSLIPVTLPHEYYEMNDFLKSQEGDFRVYWLPPSRDVLWNPSKNALDPWLGSGTKELPLWASSKPTTAGASILTLGKEQEWRMFEYYTYEKLSETQYVGKLLGSEGVKYVIYHNDTFDNEKYRRIFQSLQKQLDLDLVFNNDYLYVFANEHYSSYIYASDKAILVVGGLDVLLPLCNLDAYIPYDYPLIFLEQYPLTKTNLETYLKFADTILFYGEKDFEDLILSTIDKEFLYSPANFRPAFSSWQVDFFYSSSWIKRSFLQAEGLKYDFDSYMKFVFVTSKNQTLSFPIKAPSEGTYEIWARVLQAPKSGNITFTIDDLWHSEISAKSYAGIKGFKWLKVFEIPLEEGEHKLTITNNFGTNAINLVAIIPNGELEQHKNNLLNLIKDSGARIIHLKEVSIMDKWPASGVYVSKVSDFYVPKNQNYVIALRTNVTSGPKSITINVDTLSYTLKLNEGINWNYLGPIYLNEGYHKIILLCKTKGVEFDTIFIYSINEENDKLQTLDDIFRREPLPFITKYEKINPAMIKVEVNATKPFILSLAESLDPLWVAYTEDGTNFQKVTLNSVLNGFLVNKVGTYTIIIEFVPERYFHLGMAITLSTLLIICCYLFYLTLWDRIKRHLYKLRL
jgi:hypothetical protein